MEAINAYGVGFFLAGSYHILCRERNKYRFQAIQPPCNLKPVEMDYHEARKFIESHPLCTNISNHEIRIMPYSEIQDILQGRAPESTVKSLALSSEEEEEEPLH